jgi:hypothetical protein
MAVLDNLISKEQQQGMMALGAGMSSQYVANKTGMGQNQAHLLMRNAMGLGGGEEGNGSGDMMMIGAMCCFISCCCCLMVLAGGGGFYYYSTTKKNS